MTTSKHTLRQVAAAIWFCRDASQAKREAEYANTHALPPQSKKIPYFTSH